MHGVRKMLLVLKALSICLFWWKKLSSIYHRLPLMMENLQPKINELSKCITSKNMTCRIQPILVCGWIFNLIPLQGYRMSTETAKLIMTSDKFVFPPIASLILPFLSLILLSSRPFTRDSGLNSIFPNFRTAATTSKTDCVSWSINPTICMAFWKGSR